MRLLLLSLKNTLSNFLNKRAKYQKLEIIITNDELPNLVLKMEKA